MTKYYKIEEQELLSLLSDSRELRALQEVDMHKWEGSKEYFQNYFEENPETTAEDLPSIYEEAN